MCPCTTIGRGPTPSRASMCMSMSETTGAESGASFDFLKGALRAQGGLQFLRARCAREEGPHFLKGALRAQGSLQFLRARCAREEGPHFLKGALRAQGGLQFLRARCAREEGLISITLRYDILLSCLPALSGRNPAHDRPHTTPDLLEKCLKID